jgi:hypothetical protein
MTEKVDITALANQARLPSDDPGVQTFAVLVALECARIAREALVEHDRDLAGTLPLAVSAGRVQRRLRRAFGLDDDRTGADSEAWSDQVEMLMLAL